MRPENGAASGSRYQASEGSLVRVPDSLTSINLIPSLLRESLPGPWVPAGTLIPASQGSTFWGSFIP